MANRQIAETAVRVVTAGTAVMWLPQAFGFSWLDMIGSTEAAVMAGTLIALVGIFDLAEAADLTCYK